MKGRDTFKKLREQRSRFSLHTQFTMLIAGVVLISILSAFGMTFLFEWSFPIFTKIPRLLEINILSLIVAVIVARIVTRLISDPIQELRDGMLKVSDGNFDVQLETDSSFKEIQELITGFNMMTHELQSTEILQTDFVSNVSHEFKTPINAIEGYTTLLQNAENIDGTESDYIEKILLNTRRLSSLVSNILLLSKIENQSIPAHKETYRLDEQIREVILALESAWEQKEIDFDVDLEEIHYFGNENLMYHVWMNLIGNAIKFSPQAGIVKVRLFEKENKIHFFIEDEGAGLSEEAKKHIFDKFYQADTSHKQEGNGLGLALVKRILAMTGGEVFAENLPVKGCRFTVILGTK